MLSKSNGRPSDKFDEVTAAVFGFTEESGLSMSPDIKPGSFLMNASREIRLTDETEALFRESFNIRDSAIEEFQDSEQHKAETVNRRLKSVYMNDFK